MTTVVLHTSAGKVTVELEDGMTPQTTQNFLNYAKSGFYDKTIFHRVIKEFMIQGGGFEPGMTSKKTENPIQNEAKTGLKNTIGTIAMARTSAPHSASSQFFINVANNGFLDFRSETPDGYGYCAFGKVTDGLEVVMEISKKRTGPRAGHDDVPLEDVVLERVEVL